jgi:hypothetical protein
VLVLEYEDKGEYMEEKEEKEEKACKQVTIQQGPPHLTSPHLPIPQITTSLSRRLLGGRR